MRVPVYLVCAAALVAVRGDEGSSTYFGRQLEPVDVAADQETISYLLPKLAAKYRPSNDWSGVTDPRFYVLTEMESNDIDNQITKHKKIRNKRYNYDLGRPSLSIQAPIQSLRNVYAKEKLRQRMEANRRFLENLNDLGLASRSKKAGRLGEPGGSLSIVNSLDVLRNRLLLEIARKKAKEGANRNRQMLMNLGKRAYLQRAAGVYDNKM